jgi:hypothetical protein
MEAIAQFEIKLNQLLMHVNPTMSNYINLSFLWPISRIKHQKHFTIQFKIEQIIKATKMQNIKASPTFNIVINCQADSRPSPIDKGVQNAQITHWRQLK